MNKTHLKRKKKIGFVASGGAAKAACFHMGVALALERKGFRFRRGLKCYAQPLSHTGRDIEILVGSSAGAFASALLLSGYEIEDIYNSFRGEKVPHMPRPLGHFEMLHPNWYDTVRYFMSRLPRAFAMRGGASVESFVQSLLCSNGFCTTQKLESYLRNMMLPTNDFSELSADLYMVTTLLDNPGRAIMGPRKLKEGPQVTYHTDVPISQSAAASMALPPIFKPVSITSEGSSFYCFDGEIRNTLSTHIAKDAGCDLIIASYTHQPYHFREEIGSLIDYGIPAILIQAIYQLIESKILRSKELHDMKMLVLDTIVEFFDDHMLPQELRTRLLHKLEEKMEFNRNLDYVFIAPSHHEENLFFEDHFNISPRIMAKIAEHGFKSAIRVLKDYEFTFLEDIPEGQVAGF